MFRRDFRRGRGRVPLRCTERLTHCSLLAAVACWIASETAFQVGLEPKSGYVDTHRGPHQLETSLFVTQHGSSCLLKNSRCSYSRPPFATHGSTVAKHALPDDQAPGSILEETRLLRQQTAILFEEIKLLREAVEAGVIEPSQAAAVLDSSGIESTDKPSQVFESAPVSTQTSTATPPPPSFPPLTPPSSPLQAAAVSQKLPETPVPAREPNKAPLTEEKEPEEAGDPEAAPSSGTARVKVVSAGHDSGNIADFFLDDVKLYIHGASNRRGLNIVVIDPKLGRVVTAKTYDIWGNAVEENRRVASDLNAMPEGQIVLVALKDSGMENIDRGAIAALRKFGAEIEGSGSMRESYLLIGAKGDDLAMVEKQAHRVLMSEVELPFKVTAPMPPPKPLASVPTTPPSGYPQKQPLPPMPAAAQRFPKQSPLPPLPPMPPVPSSAVPPIDSSARAAAEQARRAEVPPPWAKRQSSSAVTSEAASPIPFPTATPSPSPIPPIPFPVATPPATPFPSPSSANEPFPASPPPPSAQPFPTASPPSPPITQPFPVASPPSPATTPSPPKSPMPAPAPAPVRSTSAGTEGKTWEDIVLMLEAAMQERQASR